MKEPKIVITPIVVQSIDQQATAALMKAWRKYKRVKQCSVAVLMGTGGSNLSEMEAGRIPWTHDKVTAFLRAIRVIRREEV